MRKRIIFFLRNIAKMMVQDIVLPISYEFERLKFRGKKDLYVFADAHHTSLPFSLEAMYTYFVNRGITPVCHFYDYTHEGSWKSLLHSIAFMKLRVRAKYIFICDTFVPVSSGRRCKDTKVIQLCHYSGPFKKIGYDTSDDIPAYYSKNVFKNYDLVTASSEMYVPILESAMRQPKGVVKALGTSRSDLYHNPEWVAKCKDEFYLRYPEAKSKKIVLWAPTFRGKAGSPDKLDNQRMMELQEQLGEEWLVLIKHHPHVDATIKNPKYRSNCVIATEHLLPVVDVLITDYSTTVLDYLAYEKPFIFYVPDLEEYKNTRGLYVELYELTQNITIKAEELKDMVIRAYCEWKNGDYEDGNVLKKQFVSACDGKSTKRIVEYLELK